MCGYHTLNCGKMFTRPYGSNGFVIKASVLLVIICAPGNLLTAILLYKHWSSTDEMTSDELMKQLIKNVTNPTENNFNEVTADDELNPEVSVK